jgi:hypothetical protein
MKTMLSRSEEMTVEFEKRKRMTLEQARFHLESSESEEASHIVVNEDRSYSIARHVKQEVCDYCVEYAYGLAKHIAKKNIYESTKGNLTSQA